MDRTIRTSDYRSMEQRPSPAPGGFAAAEHRAGTRRPVLQCSLFGLVIVVLLASSTGSAIASTPLSAPAPPAQAVHPDQSPPSDWVCGTFTASLAITSPAPAAGPAGTHLTLVGSGFYASGHTGYIELELTDESGTPLLPLGTISSGTPEPFTVNLDFPDTSTYGGLTLGTYYIWAANQTEPAVCAYTTFTLTGVNPGLACFYFTPELNVTSPVPATGGANAPVTLQGSGFQDDNLTYIYWAAPDGTLLTYLVTVTSSDVGGWFNVTVNVPTGDPIGPYFFWATGGDDYCAGAMFNLTAVPTLVLTPDSGAGGTLVTATGYGFSTTDSGVNLTGAVLLFPLPCAVSGGAITGSCQFQVDGGLAGPQTITAIGNVVGGPSDTATAAFTLFPSISLDPDFGLAGAAFTVTGIDFSAGPAAADVAFDSELLTPTGGSDCGAGASDTLITPDADGGFVCTFSVPSWATLGANLVQGDDTVTSEVTSEQTFTETAPLAISTSALAPWDAGLSGYAQAISATGGAAPYTWSAIGLPAGLEIGLTTGVITGTPHPANGGVFSVVVTVTDADGVAAHQSFRLTINPDVEITTAALASWDANVPGYSQPMFARGGTGALTWTATNLPAGLGIDPTTGRISGTPTESNSRPFLVVVTATDSAGDVAQQSYLLTIFPGLAIATSALAGWDVGVPGYLQLLSATGSIGVPVWSATGLPPGLTLIGGGGLAASGEIRGTPTSSSGSPYSVTVTVRNSDGLSARQTFSLAIYPGLAITTTSLPSWDAGVPGYTAGLSATGAIGKVSWSASGLPPGLTLLPAGAIVGTPTVASHTPYVVVISVKDSKGQTDQQSYAVTILTASVETVSSTSGAPGPVTFTVDGVVPSTGFDVYIDSAPGVLSSSSVSVGSCTSTSSGSLTDCTVDIPAGLNSGVYFVDVYQDPASPPFVLSVFSFTVIPVSPGPSLLLLFGGTVVEYEVGVAAFVIGTLGTAAAVSRRRRGRAGPPTRPTSASSGRTTR